MQLKILALPLISLMLYACGKSEHSYEQVQDKTMAIQTDIPAGADGAPQAEKERQPQPLSPEQQPWVTADSAASPVPSSGTSSKQSHGYIDWDKKIIKTANLTLECTDYKAFNTDIHTRLKQYGAYISQEQQEESNYKISNTISIKIPVDQFEGLVNSLNGNGIKLITKNITSEDVTGEYVDTKSRLLAKEAVRMKYFDLLKQARTMDEILKVQDEINSIQEDIEAGSSRVNYLQHASAYSTVNITYYQYINGSKGDEDNPGFFSQMNEAFKTGASIISNIVLFAISIWPLLIAGMASFIYIRKRKSSFSKKQVAGKDISFIPKEQV